MMMSISIKNSWYLKSPLINTWAPLWEHHLLKTSGFYLHMGRFYLFVCVSAKYVLSQKVPCFSSAQKSSTFHTFFQFSYQPAPRSWCQLSTGCKKYATSSYGWLVFSALTTLIAFCCGNNDLHFYFFFNRRFKGFTTKWNGCLTRCKCTTAFYPEGTIACIFQSDRHQFMDSFAYRFQVTFGYVKLNFLSVCSLGDNILRF